MLFLSCDLSSLNSTKKIKGIVDTSFGTNGYFIYNGNTNKNDFANDIKIDQNGKLVICGETETTNDKSLCLLRVTSNGVLDKDFGTNGVFIKDNISGANGDDGLNSFVFDSEKKIVAVGYSNNGSNDDIIIIRVNSVGTLDTSFNGCGYVYTDLNNQNNIAKKVIIDSDNKLIVLADSYNGSNWDIAILRYTKTGLVDTAFNTGHIILSNSAGGNGDDKGNDIILDSQGRIIVTGYSTDASGDKKAMIWRINPNGNLDTSFNSKGYMIIDETNKNANGATLHYINGEFIGDKKIILSGEEGTDDTTPFMMRFDYQLEKDNTFGNNGIVHISNTVSSANGKEVIYDFCRDSFSRYFICGYSTKDNKINFGIWGYNTIDATIDKTFASNGFLRISDEVSSDPTCDIFTSMSINTTEYLYCAGYIYNDNNYDMVIYKIK